ncbi:hypothetical protein AB0368_28430 [Actinoplanes sp. NPDC051475]|uniref:hypothetical protein n=1 Tax=Actinoplanes sp. NPDC051475 TaxID=3157225 RepID=UPI00344D57F3
MGDPGINVETGGLTKFATDVHVDTDSVLAPATERAGIQLGDGVRFGEKNASGAVHAAKVRYAEGLAASTANLQEYVNAAKLLAAAAEKVAADFDASDTRAAKTTEQAEQALWAAAQEARAARLAVEQAQNPPRHGGQAAAV